MFLWLKGPLFFTLDVLVRNASDVLMAVTYDLPNKITGNTLRADQLLYNDLIDYFETTEARWARQNISIGQRFTKAMSNALWYLDPHHDTLSARGISLPVPLQRFCNYNDYKRKKEKKPHLSQIDLDQHVNALSSFLLQPWICHSRFTELHNVTENLVEGMRKYQVYLRESSQRNSRQQHSTELIRSSEDVILVCL